MLLYAKAKYCKYFPTTQLIFLHFPAIFCGQGPLTYLRVPIAEQNVSYLDIFKRSLSTYAFCLASQVEESNFAVLPVQPLTGKRKCFTAPCSLLPHC